MSSPLDVDQQQPARFTRGEVLLLTALCIVEWVIVTGTETVTYLFPAISRLYDVPLGVVVFVRTAFAATGLLAPLLLSEP